MLIHFFIIHQLAQKQRFLSRHIIIDHDRILYAAQIIFVLIIDIAILSVAALLFFR
jgi:hypothetical protein